MLALSRGSDVRSRGTLDPAAKRTPTVQHCRIVSDVKLDGGLWRPVSGQVEVQIDLFARQDYPPERSNGPPPRPPSYYLFHENQLSRQGSVIADQTSEISASKRPSMRTIPLH